MTTSRTPDAPASPSAVQPSSDGSPAAEEHNPARRSVERLTAFRARVRALPGGALGWRIGVTVVGVAVIVGGIILLPLPGPGWLVIFAGLGILGTEYEWAKRLLRFARDQVKRWTDWAAKQPRWLQAILGLLGIAFLVAVALAAWWLVH